MVARASGQIIFVSAQTSDIMKIDVSDWAQGVYLIRIINGNESRIIKFVKE
ncbi:MAG: T9SS type A sorting domain-containing protein [Salinivirgaceae bacterium]|nr:T9SS type A sorting domain-containing protein [Salinivirgaceae bacterium]